MSFFGMTWTFSNDVSVEFLSVLEFNFKPSLRESGSLYLEFRLSSFNECFRNGVEKFPVLGRREIGSS